MSEVMCLFSFQLDTQYLMSRFVFNPVFFFTHLSDGNPEEY